MDGFGDAFQELGFPFVNGAGSWEVQNPLALQYTFEICISPMLPGDAAAVTDLCNNKVYFSLKRWEASTYPSPKAKASIRSTVIHEAYHNLYQHYIFSYWVNLVCQEFTEPALSQCQTCMQGVIQCYLDNHQPCLEQVAYGYTVAALCESLQEPGLSQTEIDAITDKIEEACAKADEEMSKCGLAGCTNTCGNHAPLPLFPASSACECP